MHRWAKWVIEKLHETLLKLLRSSSSPSSWLIPWEQLLTLRGAGWGCSLWTRCLWITFLQPCPSHWKTEGTKAPKDPFKGTYLCRLFLIYVYWLYINTAYTSLFLSLSLSLSLPLYTYHTHFNPLRDFVCLGPSKPPWNAALGSSVWGPCSFWGVRWDKANPTTNSWKLQGYHYAIFWFLKHGVFHVYVNSCRVWKLPKAVQDEHGGSFRIIPWTRLMYPYPPYPQLYR